MRAKRATCDEHAWWHGACEKGGKCHVLTRAACASDVADTPPAEIRFFFANSFRSALFTCSKRRFPLQTNHTKPPPAGFRGAVRRSRAITQKKHAFYTPSTRILSRRSSGSEMITAVCGTRVRQGSKKIRGPGYLVGEGYSASVCDQPHGPYCNAEGEKT